MSLAQQLNSKIYDTLIHSLEQYTSIYNKFQKWYQTFCFKQGMSFERWQFWGFTCQGLVIVDPPPRGLIWGSQWQLLWAAGAQPGTLEVELSNILVERGLLNYIQFFPHEALWSSWLHLNYIWITSSYHGHPWTKKSAEELSRKGLDREYFKALCHTSVQRQAPEIFWTDASPNRHMGWVASRRVLPLFWFRL